MSDRHAVRVILIHDSSLLVMKRNKYGNIYHTLIGGGIESGEDPETALRRELREECSMEVGDVRLVFIEDASERFGKQYVFYCEYIGGEPVLASDSEEAADNRAGQDTYLPMWLPLSQLPRVIFHSGSVQAAILNGLRDGFPEVPQALAWKP